MCQFYWYKFIFCCCFLWLFSPKKSLQIQSIFCPIPVQFLSSWSFLSIQPCCRRSTESFMRAPQTAIAFWIAPRQRLFGGDLFLSGHRRQSRKWRSPTHRQHFLLTRYILPDIREFLLHLLLAHNFVLKTLLKHKSPLPQVHNMLHQTLRSVAQIGLQD